MNELIDDEHIGNLYQLAKAFLVEKQLVSVSLLQRQFKIQYSCALDLMDQLERNGVVTVCDSGGGRTFIGQSAE